jgi:hypothetical protein
MKRTLIVAGSLGFVGLGLVTAAPASAAPSTDVGCAPRVLCTIRDTPGNFVAGIATTPQRFVTGIVTTPDRFLNGRDPADPTDGLLGTPTRFVSGIVGTPERFVTGIVTTPERFVTGLLGTPERFVTGPFTDGPLGPVPEPE